jgi:ABC-type lipoprotein release transport system permease subunit
MLTVKIAWRNVFRQKRRTLLTVLAMFAGFVLSSVSIGWADGAYNNVIEMFTRNRLGHIQIHREGYLDKPSLYKTIDEYTQVGQKVEETQGVEAWAPRLYSAGLVSVADNSAGARIIGIDPDRENITTRFDKKIVTGKSFNRQPSHEAILGRSLARKLKASVGDSIVILSQAADGSMANDLYEIVGLIESGDAMTDQTAFYLHLLDAQQLLVLPGSVHELVVVVDELDDVGDIAARLSENLDDTSLAVAPWQEFAKSFYTAMKADQQGAWLMILIITLIVAVGVLNTILMNVLERQREYGVLRAVGTRPGQICRLVLIEVFFLALISIIVGAAGGLIANSLLAEYGISLSESFSYGGVEFTDMKGEVNARSFYIPTVVVMIAALLVSLYPALKAARVEPARAMRMH